MLTGLVSLTSIEKETCLLCSLLHYCWFFSSWAAPNSWKGHLYLIRASFLYGNYDGEDKLPEFDPYLDVNLWSSVKFSNASDVVTTEIIGAAVSDTKCLPCKQRSWNSLYISIGA
ncbi:hypothetical protein REPUB_Repub18cG0103700 [Reevesia pubescens]